MISCLKRIRSQPLKVTARKFESIKCIPRTFCTLTATLSVRWDFKFLSGCATNFSNFFGGAVITACLKITYSVSALMTVIFKNFRYKMCCHCFLSDDVWRKLSNGFKSCIDCMAGWILIRICQFGGIHEIWICKYSNRSIFVFKNQLSHLNFVYFKWKTHYDIFKAKPLYDCKICKRYFNNILLTIYFWFLSSWNSNIVCEVWVHI